MAFGSSDFADPADRPEASYRRHPVEDMEPELSANEQLAELGEAFQRVLAWAAESGSIVQMGQRMYVMLYILRPALIEGMTLERIGAQSQVTRAAIDKLVVDFRDTFHVRSRPMKSEETRKRCRRAQLSRV